MNEDKFTDAILLIAALAIIVLKLCNVIKISWLWLLSPLWIPLAVGVVFCFVILLWAIIYSIILAIKGEYL